MSNRRSNSSYFSLSVIWYKFGETEAIKWSMILGTAMLNKTIRIVISVGIFFGSLHNSILKKMPTIIVHSFTSKCFGKGNIVTPLSLIFFCIVAKACKQQQWVRPTRWKNTRYSNVFFQELLTKYKYTQSV